MQKNKLLKVHMSFQLSDCIIDRLTVRGSKWLTIVNGTDEIDTHVKKTRYTFIQRLQYCEGRSYEVVNKGYLFL